MTAKFISFAKLVGNQRNKEILQRLLKNGRINSTLIFAGPDSVGKRQFEGACRRLCAGWLWRLLCMPAHRL
jgi:hypothetical protein